MTQNQNHHNTNTNTNNTNQSDANHSSTDTTSTCTDNNNINNSNKFSQQKVPVQVIRKSQKQQQQPWETSEQAKIIHKNILERAGIQLITSTTESASTSLSYCTTRTDYSSSIDGTLSLSLSSSSSISSAASVSLPIPFLSTLTTIEIKQLIAFVWWKYGIPLADFFVQLQNTTVKEKGSVKENNDDNSNNTNNNNNNNYDTRTILKNENMDTPDTNYY